MRQEFTRAAHWCGVFAALFIACSGDDPTGGGAHARPTLVDAFPGRVFSRATDLRNAGDDRLFVVQQDGAIVVFGSADTTQARVFLDLTSTVASGGELGLLSLAFHPDYAANGQFFVYYTANSAGSMVSRLSRFRVSANPDSADATSEKVLLEIPQRLSNHNGGGLCFGAGSELFVGVGDEGGAGDEFDNAQNRSTLHGSILRIDVNQNSTSAPWYGIPADNPFVGNGTGWREEIYAYGLRNPWRISYDPVTGLLWAADVGQDEWEEIDHVVSGGNYGWDCREGAHDFVPVGGQDPPSAACAGGTAMVDPVFEYGHADFNESITGGFVYTGTANPALRGAYVFGDFVSGRIWALRNTASGFAADLVADAPFLVSSFGRDAAGELYVVAYGPGEPVYRIVETTASPSPPRGSR